MSPSVGRVWEASRRNRRTSWISGCPFSFESSWEHSWLEVQPQDFHPALFRLALPRVVRHVEFVTLPGPQRPVIERTLVRKLKFSSTRALS